MSDTGASPRPAWARESSVLRLAHVVSLRDLSPEWAFSGTDGSGVRVAVIDSGIDVDHPLLGGCVDEGAAVEFLVDGDGTVVERAGPHRDVFGHGTACAGIIHSLAPRATLTSVKVLGVGLRGKVAAFLAGLRWAVDRGFDVVNLSLGASRIDSALAFHEICDDAYFKRVFIVTAANNVARPSYPSLYAAVTNVACNVTDDPRRYHFNPDPPTEFLARGIGVEVAWLGGGTSTVTGNSFAAPHIVGLAAQVLSKHRDLRPFQLKTVLWSCAANVREGSAPQPAGRLTAVMRRQAADARATRHATGIIRREVGHGL